MGEDLPRRAQSRAQSLLPEKGPFDEEPDRSDLGRGTKGDLILAWQSDLAAAVGLCEVVGWEKSSGEGTDLVLRPIEVFTRPVRLHDLKKTTHPELKTVASLKQGNAATIYPTTAKEARTLLAACGSAHTL